jgi:enoyl-CoA hydratase
LRFDFGIDAVALWQSSLSVRIWFMLQLKFQDRVAHVQLDHGKVNAMDLEFCRELIDLFDRVADDDSAAVILRGNDRVFSAGVDLKRFLREGTDYVEPFITALEELFLRAFLFPKPTIAVLHGHAIAGGCMLACACDYRLVAPTTRIGIPELRIGVPLPMTAIEIVRFVAAPHAFQRVVHVGATYVGQAAVDVGLADEVAPPNQLIQRSSAVAAEYTSIPLPTYQLTKRQVRGPIVRQIDANRNQLMPEYLRLWKSPETRQAIHGYVEQRLN